MNIMQRIIELERRLERVEANRGASLRYGTITESNTGGSARVQLHDGEEMVSRAVRTLHRRTLKDKDQCLPDLGEQVAVLFAGQGMEEGCVLGAVYSGQDASPGEEQPMQFYRFEDGTVIFYDRVNHKFYADIKGDADVKILKNATVFVDENASVKVKGTADVQVEKDATIRSSQRLILEGMAGVRMRGPSIIFEGIDGKPCQAEINADLKVKGLVDHKGNLIQFGNQDVSGNIAASGSITGNPVHGCDH